jgi:predicted exporter
MSKTVSLSHLRFGLWFCLVLSALVALLAWPSAARINTNVLDLLPKTEQEPLVAQALGVFSHKVARNVIFLVEHQNLEEAERAADVFYGELSQLPIFASIHYRVDFAQWAQLSALYDQHASGLLAANDAQQLAQGNVQVLFDRTLQQLFMSPSASAQRLTVDPLGLQQQFMAAGRTFAAGLRLEGDRLVASGENADHAPMHYVMISAEFKHDPFSVSAQQRLAQALTAAKAKVVEQVIDAQVLQSGMVFFAAAGVNSAKHEISTVGVGSLLGIVLLIAVVLRSFWPLLVALLPIAAGSAAGFVACMLVFGEVHLLSLVFGSSLVGVSIDYAFHYFTERQLFPRSQPVAWQSTQGLRAILPGLSMGLITSVIGYGCLAFSSFPGIRQLALFSCTGLVAAFAAVVLLFPWLLRMPARYGLPAPLLRSLGAYVDFWRQPGRLVLAVPLVVVVVSVMIVAVSAGGWWQLHADDDIRLLQSPSAAVLAEDQRVKEVMGAGSSNQFFILKADSAEALLQAEEQLSSELQGLMQAGVLTGYQGVSQMLPSVKKQSANQQLLAEHLVVSKALAVFLANLGLAPDAVATLEAKYSTLNPLLPASWLAHPASQNWRFLWLGQAQKGAPWASVVLLEGVSDSAALAALASSNILWVDKVSDYSLLFKRYRHSALWLLAMAYGVILAVLMLRYGVRNSVAIMLPPLMACGLTFAGLGYLAETINLFNVLALLLVLGIGIDYTLFLKESAADVDEHKLNATLLAIVLSAVTTILSFGLLALSATQAIHSFGLTVGLGIGFSLMLAPMALAVFSSGRLLPSDKLTVKVQ